MELPDVPPQERERGKETTTMRTNLRRLLWLLPSVLFALYAPVLAGHDGT